MAQENRGGPLAKDLLADCYIGVLLAEAGKRFFLPRGRRFEASVGHFEAATRRSEGSKRRAEASVRHAEASKRPAERSKRRIEASRRHFEGSDRPIEASRRSIEASKRPIEMAGARQDGPERSEKFFDPTGRDSVCNQPVANLV